MLVRIQPPRRPRRSLTGKGAALQKRLTPRRLPHSDARPFSARPADQAQHANSNWFDSNATHLWVVRLVGGSFLHQGIHSPRLVHSDARRFTTRETTRFRHAPPTKPYTQKLVRFQHPQPLMRVAYGGTFAHNENNRRLHHSGVFHFRRTIERVSPLSCER
jgi:hypothetical protein